MNLPIGILIFWVKRHKENQGIISGLWYYKEIGVPMSTEEKKSAIGDLKTGRCTLITILGRYEQILDIILQGDRYEATGKRELAAYQQFLDEFEALPEDKLYFFEDAQQIKGTSLLVDTVIEVEESMEEVKFKLKEGKGVYVSISESWSLGGEISRTFRL